MFKKNKVLNYASEFVQWGLDKWGPLYPLFSIKLWKVMFVLLCYKFFLYTHPHTFIKFYFYKECNRVPLEVEW